MSINLLLIFFVLIVVAMIAFILVQKGSGATAGSAFGSGASSTVFGAKGSGNFLTKTTMTLAFLFFAISMFMAVQASKNFTVEQTGNIDLGVLGTLDVNESDVPTITPVGEESSDVPAVDVPAIDVQPKTEAVDSDVPVAETMDEVKEESDSSEAAEGNTDTAVEEGDSEKSET